MHNFIFICLGSASFSDEICFGILKDSRSATKTRNSQKTPDRGASGCVVMNRWLGSRTRKATGKSLSDAVLYYCVLDPQFVLRLRCLWQKRFYSDRPVGRFLIFLKHKFGTLGEEGVWRRRQNFKTSHNGKSKVNYL